MTRPPHQARTHRDVTRAANRLDQAQHALAWLARQLEDIHELAYGQQAGGDGVHVQTGNASDLSNRLGIVLGNDDDDTKPDRTIGTPPQKLWARLDDFCDRLNIEAIRLEAAAQRILTTGSTNSDPTPGKNLPRRIMADLTPAQARRRKRGDYTPTQLQ